MMVNGRQVKGPNAKPKQGVMSNSREAIQQNQKSQKFNPKQQFQKIRTQIYSNKIEKLSNLVSLHNDPLEDKNVRNQAKVINRLESQFNNTKKINMNDQFKEDAREEKSRKRRTLNEMRRRVSAIPGQRMSNKQNPIDKKLGQKLSNQIKEWDNLAMYSDFKMNHNGTLDKLIDIENQKGPYGEGQITISENIAKQHLLVKGGMINKASAGNIKMKVDRSWRPPIVSMPN